MAGGGVGRKPPAAAPNVGLRVSVGRLFGVTAEGARKWLRPLAACGKVKVCRPQADTGNIFYFLPDVEREFIQNAATARLKK